MLAQLHCLSAAEFLDVLGTDSDPDGDSVSSQDEEPDDSNVLITMLTN